MLIERNESAPRHPMTAPEMLRAMSDRMLPGRGTPLHQKPRAQAVAETLRQLGEAAPNELDGWAVLTYYLVAGCAAPRGDRGFVAHAARQATLIECYRAAESVTVSVGDSLPQGVQVLDLDGAIVLADAFVACAEGAKPKPRGLAMVATLAHERAALVACRDGAFTVQTGTEAQ